MSRNVIGLFWLLVIPAFAQAAWYKAVNENARAVGATLAPISFRFITSTNNTSATTAQIIGGPMQIYANELVVVAVWNSKASAPDTPTLSGLGMNWVQLTSTNYNGNVQRLTVFRSMTNANPGSGNITINLAATPTGAGACFGAFTNVNTTGTDGSGAIVQVVKATNATANASITMAALTGSTNAVIACFANVDQNGSWGAAESPFVEDFDNGYATPATGGYMMHLVDATDNTPSVTSSAAQWAAIAVEVKHQ